MDEKECLEIGPVHRWELPEKLHIGAWLVTMVGPLIGLLVSSSTGPSAVTMILQLLLLVPTVVVLVWLIRQARLWWRSIRQRANCYEVLKNAVGDRDECIVNQTSRIHDEQLRSRELQRVLIQHAIDPAAIRIVAYETLNSVNRNGTVLLTINESNKPKLKTGDMLTVMDPEDAKFLATLTVTSEYSGTGCRIATIERSDPVYMGYIRAKANRIEPLRQRSRAYGIIMNNQGDAG